MSDPDRIPADPVVKLFGAMLMAVGGLIAILSGLCSLGFLGVLITNAFHSPAGAGSALAMSPLVLLFGGVPFAVGAAVFIVGRKLFKGD